MGKSRLRAEIVGWGRPHDGQAPPKPVISGDAVFRLMDSLGLPLEVIADTLRERGVAFDVVSFLRAAIASGNYTLKTALDKLEEAIRCAPGEGRTPEWVNAAFDRIREHPESLGVTEQQAG